MLASERQFLDHVAAVWSALPDDARGDVLVPRQLHEHRAALGIPHVGEIDRSRPVLVAAYGDVKRARLEGRRRIAYIEHGAGQSYPADQRGAGHPSYAGGRDRADVGLVMVPGPYSGDLWRKAYPGVRVEEVGCPKLDMLPPRDDSPGPVVALAFHWDCRLVQETRTAFYTYRPALEEITRRWTVIGHGHPRAMDGPPDLRKEYRRRSIELVEDFADVCRRADLLVFDNTSAGFEFASLGRPVLVLNEPIGRTPDRGYRRDRHHGLRFWDAAGVGINVWSPADLPDAIERALSDPPEVAAAREAALRRVYTHRSGAAARAAGVLMEWAADVLEAVA